MNEGLWSHERERMHNRWLEKVLGEFDQTLKPLPYNEAVRLTIKGVPASAG